jgi:hypothetical protein
MPSLAKTVEESACLSTGGVILTGEAEYSGKNLPHYYFELGLNPGIRDERSTTNRLMT